MQSRYYIYASLVIISLFMLNKAQDSNKFNLFKSSEIVKINNSQKLNEAIFLQKNKSEGKLKFSKEPIKKITINEKSNVLKLIDVEVKKLYEIDENPDKTESRLRSHVKKLSASEIDEITTVAINEKTDFDQRNVAVYLLTLIGPAAQENLLTIFFSPSDKLNQSVQPHSIQEIQKENEYSLRIIALEAIEKNIHQTKKTFSIHENFKNKYLMGLIKIVRLGEKMQKPLLKDFINQNSQVESL